MPVKELRRTFTPYAGGCVILCAFTLLELFAAIQLRDLSVFLWTCPPFWAIAALYVLLARRYRVLYSRDGVTMCWDFRKRTITYEDITSIRYETASLADGNFMTRPFRRIVIHGRRKDRNAYIDVSLRHFEPGDIEALFRELSGLRPDLTIPWKQIQKHQGGWHRPPF